MAGDQIRNYSGNKTFNRIYIMGKKILTTHQRLFLEQASRDPEITRLFYLTGGTALTEFYLQHRLSEDLDFFSESDINITYLKRFFTEIESKLNITGISTKEHHGMIFFFITFSDKSELKVDFVHFPYKQVENSLNYNKLKIDSIFDIALNKLYTLSDKPRARDYIDLYCILKKEGVSIEQLVDRMNDKFHPFTFNDKISLGLKMMRVMEAKNFPPMLIPFDHKKMEDFFLSEAKKLEKKIFK